jgi:hypothetical protein
MNRSKSRQFPWIYPRISGTLPGLGGWGLSFILTKHTEGVAVVLSGLTDGTS